MEFINGFDSWHETHFEVVSVLQEQVMQKGTLANEICNDHGQCSLYPLAKRITDAFELKNKDRFWDGEFLDEVREFVINYN